MILVIVGTHFKGFERLVSAMDDLAGRVEEPVLMQIGASSYSPKNAKFFRTTSYENMQRLISDARLVVAHAGSGCVLDCVVQGKVPILVPRQARFGEARDDHQLELAGEVAKAGLAVVAKEVEDLEGFIRSSARIQPHTREPKSSLARFVRQYIERAYPRPPDRVKGKK